MQSKVNQLYKATASQTLKAMQGLYEAKLLSYPRTDTPFITENEFAYLKANFGNYTESALAKMDDLDEKFML